MFRHSLLLSGIALFGLVFMSHGKSDPPNASAKTDPSETVHQAKKPKNIIFLIGDGMGLTQVTAALYSNNNHLNLENFPVTGLMKTSASNKLITDSAAGATAFSCGCKTYNGAVGMDEKGKPCRHLTADAKRVGYAVGLVSTSSLTHATPASFVAHAKQRSEMENIAIDIAESDIDFLVGGGKDHFAKRKDGRNLIDEMVQKGRFVSDWTEMQLPSMRPSPTRPFAWFAAGGQPKGVREGRDYLPPSGKIAVEYLSRRSDKGFFLMIEGAQIDWGGHANNANQTIAETLDFDATIGELLEWAEQDGETLIVVTADHETGGMAIQYGSKANDLKIAWTDEYHTGTLVPVFAFGPGSEHFAGIFDNTEIYFKFRQLLELQQGI